MTFKMEAKYVAMRCGAQRSFYQLEAQGILMKCQEGSGHAHASPLPYRIRRTAC